MSFASSVRGTTFDSFCLSRVYCLDTWTKYCTILVPFNLAVPPRVTLSRMLDAKTCSDAKHIFYVLGKEELGHLTSKHQWWQDGTGHLLFPLQVIRMWCQTLGWWLPSAFGVGRCRDDLRCLQHTLTLTNLQLSFFSEDSVYRLWLIEP